MNHTDAGRYDPLTNQVKPGTAQWAFGKEERPSIAHRALKTRHPSPNAYLIPSSIGGPKVSMGGFNENIDPLKNNKNPGPGWYRLDEKERNLTQYKHGLRYSLGTGASREHSPHLKEQREKPGAGTYMPSVNIQKRSSPQYGFGTAKRISSRIESTPGPGAYKLPSKVAVVPRYV
jgi:hypothetical protein